MAVPVQASSNFSSLALACQGTEHGMDSPVRRTLGLSLLLHLAVFLVALLVSWKTSGERPLASAVQVSLITLPPAPKVTDARTPTAPPPARKPAPAPQPKVELPKPVTLPVPPVKAPAPEARPPVPLPPALAVNAPAPLPPIPRAKVLPPMPEASQPRSARSAAQVPMLPPRPSAPAANPRSSADNPFRGALKDLDLPREAPKFGELSPERPTAKVHEPTVPSKPARVSERTKQDVQNLLGKLKIPEQQRVAMPVPPVDEPRETRPHASLDEDYKQELDKELQRLRQSTPATTTATKFATAEVKTAEARPAPPPVPEAKPAPVAKLPAARPEMMMDVQGAGPGANAYLALVQQRISSYWRTPPVEIPAGSFVVIRFRLARDGTITSVTVEQSSGNDYYDLAAKRAVLDTERVPPFPKHLTDPFFDAHFSFVFGGQTG